MLLDNLITTNQPFVIAEIGNNHEGSLDLAIELVELAVKSKADAVKFKLLYLNYFSFPEIWRDFKSYLDFL